MADHDPTAAVKESHSRSPAEGSDHSSPNDPSNAAMAEFHLNIEVGSDQDSTFGGSDEGGSTTTTSLASSVFDYVYENGRRYHKYREGSYALPNDDQEQERLDMLHHIFGLVIGGALHKSPISSPHNVLDIGTGTGIWALDFADEYPEAQVLGNDLSPIQPSWTAPNCRFVVDDVESPWAYPASKRFDLIHQRNMVGSIANWPRLFQQAFDHLAPGGWYEAQEFDVWFHAQAEPLSEESHIMKWQTLLDQASSQFGKRLNCFDEVLTAFGGVSFENVTHEIFKVPIGRWPKDRKLRETGMYLQAQMLDSVEPVSMAYFTRVLGWTREETLVFIAKVRKEFQNDRSCLYVYCHFLRGQKPAAE
ncbi:hypothetical protein PV10_00650 [Exophiala mesophila]|uniref:Methyltransferase domain-containing protein n=1 Tax=Exophiala mesophila TaxID=212818 RepID=A0A0D2AD27_EXOME|nr:uncharacterized protein PV10_00650 [Exophiala mesophila]KIV96833.1 hypothetical protein PV10_00650 [Exophiala mesophila]